MFEQYANSTIVAISTTDATPHTSHRLLRDSVTQSLKNYFSLLEGEKINDLYELVLAEVEQPLLDMVMQYTRGNQTRAATIMGVNRGTLRKKLKKYRMG